MLSRALLPATVLFLICALAPERSLAQENLDAGKSPSQIFAGTCNACHKSPRGLLKTVSPSSLPSFLRQHYTTSPNMAGVLSSYLVSNGATDSRSSEGPKGTKGSKEGVKESAKEGARQEARQRPEPDAATQANPDHAEGHRGAAKQRLGKHGKPPEEPAATAIEPPKPEPPKSDTASEPSKPSEEGHSQSAKVEQPAETSAVRPDPVPPVTPAPSSAPEAAKPETSSPAPTTVSTSAPDQPSVTPEGTEMAVPLPPSVVPPAPPPSPPAVTASVPPLVPAGPPAPPISQ